MAAGGGGTTLIPSPGGAYQAVGNDEKPEVDNQPLIRLKRLMARQVESGGKKEIRHVAQNNGAESLNQIYQHRGFRHRLHRKTSDGRTAASKNSLEGVTGRSAKS